jgi:hypothetical protein
LLNPEVNSACLLGRLGQECREPLAPLLTASPGPWQGFNGVHVLAVTDGLLWVARPRLLAEPAISTLALSAVRRVAVRTRRPLSLRRRPDVVRLDIEVGGRTVRYTAFADVEACQAFVAVLRRCLPTPA